MREKRVRAAKRGAFDALAPWAAGIALALPVALLRFPPMRDLPLHEVVVSVLRHWGDARYFPPGLYVHSFGMPNQLFFFLAWPLAYLVSVPMACKLVAAATITAMPVVAARFARSQGRPGWVGVLAAPVMLGWLFVWGVIANMIGLVVLFAALPALDRWTLAPSPRNAVKTLGVLLLLDLAHEEMLALAWLFVVMVALVARPRRAWLAWGSVALSVGVALAQQVVIEGLRTPESASNRSTYAFTALAQRLRVAPGMLFPGQDALTRGAAWLVVLAPIAWLLVGRARTGPRAAALPMELRGDGSLRDRLVEARFAIFAALLVVGYLVAPYDAGNTHLIFHRFLPPAFVLAVTLAAPRTADWEAPRALAWVSLAAPLAALAVILPTSLECDEMFRHFETLLPLIEPGSAVIALDTHSSGAELLRGLDLQGHAVALRGGRTFFDYTQSPTSPALLAKRAEWNDSTRRLLHGEDLRPAWDLKRYRYVFVHILRPEEIGSVRFAMTPEAHFVDSAGDWMLFESNILSVPIDAPDAPLPSPAPPSFAEKYAGAAL